MYKKKILPNGLKLVTHRMRQRQSVAVGVWIGVGGRNEEGPDKGAAHFLEHILFKGSQQYSCEEIKGRIEGVGGTLNAFTAEEHTCYFAKIPAEHIERTTDILMDLVLAPAFTAREVGRERTVILEELKMYRDLPQYHVMDMLDRLIWPNHPLGINVGGTMETVAAITNSQLRRFHQRYYFPHNMVVAACGHVDHEAFCQQVEQRSAALPQGDVAAFQPARDFPLAAEVACEVRPIEQMHVAMAFPGFPDLHPDKYALNLMHIILGGNMSSRLFHEVREKKGLAYSISTGIKSLSDTGVFLVRAGVENEKLLTAVNIILKEFRRFRRQGPSDQEFQRAKDYYKGQVMLSLEDSLDHMLWVAEDLLDRNRTRSLKQVISHIDAVQPSDLRRIAATALDASHMKLALIGPLQDSQRQDLHRLVTGE